MDFVNKCIPHNDVVIRPNNKPWYDSEIRKHNRKRDRQKAKTVRTSLQNDWIKYKNLRNQVNNLKKHAKETFNNNLELSLMSKLTRNKNARHIFPHHFFPVAMIGIICLHVHFVLYTLNTRSIFFKYLNYFRLYDHHCTNCTCTSCAPTTRFF